jgi:hypothetical protein
MHSPKLASAPSLSAAGIYTIESGMEGSVVMQKRIAGCLVSFLLPVSAWSGNLAAVAGHYRYEQYTVTLSNQRVLSLNDLGATNGFLDISDDGTITLRMTTSAGNTVTETAKVLEAHFSGTEGYWIAQWPDMTYPVRAQIIFNKGLLVSTTHFRDKSDVQRFGSTEHAVLRKVVVD